MKKEKYKHIALLTSSLSGGGAEAVLISLAKEFLKRDIKIDFLVCKYSGQLAEEVPTNINIIKLNKDNPIRLFFCFAKLPPINWLILISTLFIKKPKSFSRTVSLKNYITKSKPDILISCLNPVNITSLMAKHLTHTETIFIIQQVNFPSKSIFEKNSFFNNNLLPSLIRNWYKNADAIVSVTEAVKKDLVTNFKIPCKKITTIYNPLDLQGIRHLAYAPPQDTWLHEDIPILLAVGRLSKVKNYPFLFNVVRKINDLRPVRLIVLGEGPEKQNLENLIKELDLIENIKMLGYKKNPYNYMKHTDIFILTSKSEGLGNVLQEALACGCKIVSIDCPGGPREILSDGKFGKLTPENDILSMATAISESIDANIDSSKLELRAAEFSSKKIVRRYLDLFSTLTNKQ